jgi:hypothetical protein
MGLPQLASTAREVTQRKRDYQSNTSVAPPFRLRRQPSADISHRTQRALYLLVNRVFADIRKAGETNSERIHGVTMLHGLLARIPQAIDFRWQLNTEGIIADDNGCRRSGKPLWLRKGNPLNRSAETNRIESHPGFAPEPDTGTDGLMDCERRRLPQTG